MTKVYLVRWETQVEAASPEEAAEMARNKMKIHDEPQYLHVIWGGKASKRVHVPSLKK